MLTLLSGRESRHSVALMTRELHENPCREAGGRQQLSSGHQGFVPGDSVVAVAVAAAEP